MTWVESQLNDEDIFPIKFDAPFPKKFPAICATIYKRFFRIYVTTTTLQHHHHNHIRQHTGSPRQAVEQSQNGQRLTDLSDALLCPSPHYCC